MPKVLLGLAKDNMDLAVKAAKECDLVRTLGRAVEAGGHLQDAKGASGAEWDEAAMQIFGKNVTDASVDWTRELLAAYKRCGCRLRVSSRRFTGAMDPHGGEPK